MVIPPLCSGSPAPRIIRAPRGGGLAALRRALCEGDDAAVPTEERSGSGARRGRRGGVGDVRCQNAGGKSGIFLRILFVVRR